MRKAVVIPEFKLNNLKHYEIGPIYNGRLSTIDLVATLAYCRLNKGEVKFDDVENQIINNYKIGDLYNLQSIVGSTTGSTYAEFMKKIIDPIFQKLKKDQFFVYNPRFVAFVAPAIALVVACTSPSLWLKSSHSALDYLLCSIILAVGLSIYMAAIFCEDFCENLKNILPLRRELLGYKMFLTTTEYYRIEQDKELFAKLIPFFISLGARKDKLKQMIQHVKSLDSKS